MTEEYLKEFERWVAGPKERKKRVRAELEQHLRAAEAAGDVEAMARLGTPREAAATFSAGHELEPAPLPRRIGAALVDLGIVFLPLIALAIGGLIVDPPGAIESQFTNVGGLEWMTIVFFFGAGAWWTLGLILSEWRTGRTPGKALLGLRVVTEDGISPSFGQIVIRRLTMIFSGPLQVIDWAFMFFTKKHQRAFELVAKTVVVQDETTTERLEVAAAL
ncbi:MAG TPA: RDD family protein [Actinomycetota bacterium]|nr:RDD family protein [Actinomycetota bacterium]